MGFGERAFAYDPAMLTYDLRVEIVQGNELGLNAPTIPRANSHGAVRAFDTAGHWYDSSSNFVAPSASASPWLRGTAGNAGRVPDSVRVALDGHSFSSRADFRAAFWRAAGDEVGGGASVSYLEKFGYRVEGTRMVPR